MGVFIDMIVAIIGGFVQSRRHRDRLAVDIHLVWWMSNSRQSGALCQPLTSTIPRSEINEQVSRYGCPGAGICCCT